MQYIVLDLEFNQAFNFPGKSSPPDPRCPAEVIQIGAVKMDENFKLRGSFSIYIKPKVYRRMHPFVSRLTGITAAMLKDAKFFPEAYLEFIKWIGGEKVTLCTWGGDDVKEMYRNMAYHKVNHRLLTKRYINVQQIAGEQLQFTGCIGLKAAAERFGLELDEAFHDAENDARYTAAILAAADKSKMQTLEINLKQLAQGTQARVEAINAKPLFAFAERRFKRKLTGAEMDAILAIYTAGREGRFDKGRAIREAEGAVQTTEFDDNDELDELDEPFDAEIASVSDEMDKNDDDDAFDEADE